MRMDHAALEHKHTSFVEDGARQVECPQKHRTEDVHREVRGPSPRQTLVSCIACCTPLLSLSWSRAMVLLSPHHDLAGS